MMTSSSLPKRKYLVYFYNLEKEMYSNGYLLIFGGGDANQSK